MEAQTMGDMVLAQAEATRNLYQAAAREGSRSVIETVRFSIKQGKTQGITAEQIIALIEEDLLTFERRL